VSAPAFDALLRRFSGDVPPIARRAREVITRLDPDVVEVVWERQGTVGYGVGPKKMSEHYCYLALHRAHVNLGFNRGAILPDPAGLLGGPGASLRHTRLASVEDLDRPELADLLRAARGERLHALHRE